ncbi:MAG: sensor histidine kinase, partial [Chthoniobacterales bacterium]
MERRKKRNLPSDAAAQMEDLELLTRRLIQIQEQQQQTISRELHDNVAQVLTAVNARMTLARTAKAKIPAWLQHELCDLQENIDVALTDIRTLARELRPSLLDHCGFAAALEKHVQGFRERTGMDFALELDGEAAVSFDNESLTHLFRLVQEALQNIEEHSGASRAWLRLAQQEDEMQLEIGDNGRAFTEERLVEAQRDGHLGLLGMRERAELLGGSFLLEAVPDRGTSIRVSVPVPPPRKNDAEFHL